MAKLHRSHEHDAERTVYVFHCPGCHHAHYVYVNQTRTDGPSAWSWNGSMDVPTFRPSILTWTPTPSADRCHSFVTDGKIQFLPDCAHPLAGQTVELPEWDSVVSDD